MEYKINLPIQACSLDIYTTFIRTPINHGHYRILTYTSVNYAYTMSMISRINIWNKLNSYRFENITSPKSNNHLERPSNWSRSFSYLCTSAIDSDGDRSPRTYLNSKKIILVISQTCESNLIPNINRYEVKTCILLACLNQLFANMSFY